MTSFINQYPNMTFGDILTTTNSGQGLTTTLEPLQDALGNNSPVTIARNAINFSRTGGNTFQLDGVSLTANANNINMVAGNIIATGYYVTAFNLTSAQILALSVTPLTIIASPGAGFGIIINAFIMNYIHNGISYTGGSDIILSYIPSGTVAFSPEVAGESTISGLTHSTLITVLDNTPISVNSSNIINNRIVISAPGLAYATGNGTLEVTIYYSILSMT